MFRRVKARADRVIAEPNARANHPYLFSESRRHPPDVPYERPQVGSSVDSRVLIEQVPRTI